MIFEFAVAFKKKPNIPNSTLRKDLNINDYVDVEILMKPKGVVFQGKDMKEGGKKKYFFHIDFKEMYSM